MRKLTIWDEIHEEVAKLKKLVDPNLERAMEAVSLTVYCNPRITKPQIRKQSGVRKQRVSKVLKVLVQSGWLKTEGRGVKRDALKYYVDPKILQ